MPNYVFGLRKRMRLIPEQYYRIFFTLTLVLKRRKVAGGFYKKNVHENAKSKKMSGYQDTTEFPTHNKALIA